MRSFCATDSGDKNSIAHARLYAGRFATAELSEKVVDKMTKLYHLRMAHGMTRTFVADQTGLSYRALEKLEHGVSDINRAEALTVYKLARLYRVDMTDLLALDNNTRE